MATEPCDNFAFSLLSRVGVCPDWDCNQQEGGRERKIVAAETRGLQSLSGEKRRDLPSFEVAEEDVDQHHDGMNGL